MPSTMPSTYTDDNTFTVPDYKVQQRNRAERRKYASDLTRQATEEDHGRMVGPYWVANSHPAVKAIQGFVGGYLGHGLDREEADEARQLQDVRKQLLARLPPDQQDVARMAFVPGMEDISKTLLERMNKSNDHAPIVQTDNDGMTRMYDRSGNLIKELGKVGKPGAEGRPLAPQYFTDDKGMVRQRDSSTGAITEIGPYGKSTQPPSFAFVPTDQGIQAVNPKNPGGAPINTGMQPPPSAATVAGQRAAQSGVNKIDAADQAVNANPDAFGFVQGAAGGTELGATLLNKMSTPDEITARAHVADIGSQIIHDRSGAAVTISETPRLKPFIPSAADSAKTIKAKLKQLRARMVEDGYTFGMKPGSLDAKPAKRYRLITGKNPDLKSSYEAY